MDKEDTYWCLNLLWAQNEGAVRRWIKEKAKTERTLRRAEKEISALEQAKVLR